MPLAFPQRITKNIYIFPSCEIEPEDSNNVITVVLELDRQIFYCT